MDIETPHTNIIIRWQAGNWLSHQVDHYALLWPGKWYEVDIYFLSHRCCTSIVCACTCACVFVSLCVCVCVCVCDEQYVWCVNGKHSLCVWIYRVLLLASRLQEGGSWTRPAGGADSPWALALTWAFHKSGADKKPWHQSGSHQMLVCTFLCSLSHSCLHLL